MNQQQLAHKAGLSQSSLSRFEKGQSLPDMFQARRIARALDKTLHEFADRIEQAATATDEVAKKVKPGTTMDGLTAVALGGLALLGVAAMLDDAAKKAGKKR